MKKFLLLTFSVLAFIFSLINTASANAIFDQHCASCHAGGKNIMNPDKTLTKESLDKNGVNNLDAVKALVSKGKSPMPGFASVLDEKQIGEVSQFVLDQAKKGW